MWMQDNASLSGPTKCLIRLNSRQFLRCSTFNFAEMSTWRQVLYVQVQVQLLTSQVQVGVQVLQNCTRIQLEYKYKYNYLHLKCKYFKTVLEYKYKYKVLHLWTGHIPM